MKFWLKIKNQVDSRLLVYRFDPRRYSQDHLVGMLGRYFLVFIVILMGLIEYLFSIGRNNPLFIAIFAIGLCIVAAWEIFVGYRWFLGFGKTEFQEKAAEEFRNRKVKRFWEIK